MAWLRGGVEGGMVQLRVGTGVDLTQIKVRVRFFRQGKDVMKLSGELMDRPIANGAGLALTSAPTDLGVNVVLFVDGISGWIGAT